MSKHLTLENLEKLIQSIPKSEIVGFVISPKDYDSIRAGAKVLYGVDDIKMFVAPPYTGLELYVSDMVEDGKPIPLTRKMNQPIEVKPPCRS